MEIRSSDVFLKADIAAILKALAMTVGAAAPPNDDYSHGFRTALAAIAVALNSEYDKAPSNAAGAEW